MSVHASVSLQAEDINVRLGGEGTPDQRGQYIIGLASMIVAYLTPSQLRTLGAELVALADELQQREAES